MSVNCALLPNESVAAPAPAAGVLAEQAPAVIDAYRPWFQDFQVEGEDRWALVTAVRRSDGRDSGS